MYGIRVLPSRVVRCSYRFYSKSSTKKLLEFLATMPKAHTSRISDAQRQRQNISKKSDRYPPSTVYLQVLGSGARGAPNTLYLFTDQKRYLFNCGECTQRLAHEHKVKLSRLDHIFITGKSWRNIGGLPGLSLTLQDIGVPNITLHGPEGLDELYNATKRFVIMKDMNVTMAKCTPSEDFEDNALSIKYVLLGPHDLLFKDSAKTAAKKPKLEVPDKELEEFAHDETDYYKRDKPQDSKYKMKEKSKPKPSVVIDPQKKKTEKVLHDLQKKTHCTVAYICTLKKRMGTLDLARCVERGVKPGPLLGQLKNGQDVVLPDGTLVLSRDVKTPDDPGPVFIVMEVPDLSYLKESEFSSHFDDGINPPENIPALVVHYTPPHVINHPTYRDFMAMFGPNTRHLALNSQNSCLGSEAVHRTQHKLHLLDADIFPMLRDASVPAVWNSHPVPNNDNPARRGFEDLKNKIALAQFQNIIHLEGSKGDGHVCKEEDGGAKVEVIAGRTLTMFHLRPKKLLDRSAEPKLHIQDYIQETMDVDGFVSSLDQFRRLTDNMRYSKSDSHKEFPKVVFLGTGSCIPSKTRNTSSIVLQLNENKSMILDCGEGTFGQLVRFYGGKKVNAFLRTVKAIYISHLHADHHIGLIGVLQARRDAFESAGLLVEPVHLLAPGQILTWLTTYDQQFEKIKADFNLIPNQNLVKQSDEEPQTHSAELPPSVLAGIGVQHVQTCYVAHCPNAFGLAVQIDAAHKVTYSGDTIPCDALVALGQNSTLLIHEATMEDELSEEARTKMHSTTSQAIEIGKQMNARYTLLTHFSQRYARLPRLNAHILNDNNSVGIAFDNMQITMSDLALLPHMYAPLQLMFAEHCLEMELKAAHRLRHKERQEKRFSTLNLPNSDKQSLNRARKASPGCRSTSSAPAAHAKYRESNASRLRQEMKGMTITGVVKNGPRSQSLSPMQRSANSSPTRSINSDSLAQRKQDLDTLDVMSTPRTVSETSSNSRDTDRSKSQSPSDYLVDTRSKTLNTVNPAPPPPQSSALLEKEANNMRKLSGISSMVRSNFASGYGKPLVTPINKKLVVRRDFSLQDPNSTNMKWPISRPRSPPKPWKVENRGPFSAANNHPPSPRLLIPKVDVVTSVLIHIVLWRIGHIASCLFFKIWPSAVAIIALGVLFWTAAKETSSGNSLRASNTSPNVRRDSMPGAGATGPTQKRPTSSSIQRPTRSIMKEARSNCDQPAEKTKPTPIGRYKQQRPYRKAEKEPSESPTSRPSRIPMLTRNTPTEKLKQQFRRDTSVFAAGRHNSNIHSSTKSFKPQLEDIKSSYLLLCKNKNVEKPKAAISTELKAPSLPKPKVINELQRKELLFEAKRKFQSRSFKADARYEKIEGLNWISWK